MLQEKIANLLETLATKLGTTIEHLWGVLINQAHVQVFKNIFIIITLIIVNTFVGKYAFGLFKGKSLNDNDDFYPILILIIFITLLVSSSIYGIRLTIDTFDAALNPEYWAFQKIFELVK